MIPDVLPVSAKNWTICCCLRANRWSVLIEIARPRSRTFFLPTSRDVIQVSNGHANERATEMRRVWSLPLLFALAGAKMRATPTPFDD